MTALSPIFFNVAHRELPKNEIIYNTFNPLPLEKNSCYPIWRRLPQVKNISSCTYLKVLLHQPLRLDGVEDGDWMVVGGDGCAHVTGLFP